MIYRPITARMAREVPAAWLEVGRYRLDDDGFPEKRCSHCREYLPADREFFYKGNNADGLHSWCRFCCTEYVTHKRARSA